jgi:predicted dienelactone hydrolase
MKLRLFSRFSLLFILIVLSIKLYAETNSIGIKHYTFTDSARNKTISVTLWYPAIAKDSGVAPKGIWEQEKMHSDAEINLHTAMAKNNKLPLVILSHGYQGSPASLSWFAVNLVKHGFIVVAPQHNDSAADNKPYMEHWQRAIDDSKVLQDLQHSSFANNIDFSRVGMAGYSVGTSTGLWLAGAIASTYERTINPGRQFVPEEEFPDVDSDIADYLLHNTDFKAAKNSYRDPLIKAVFLIAPGYGWAFDAKHLAKINIPVFLIAAEKDEMLYPDTNAYYFSKYIPNSAMKIIPDVGHFVFLNQAKDSTNKELSPEDKKHVLMVESLGNYHYTTEEREAVHKEVGNLSVQFFSDSLK